MLKFPFQKFMKMPECNTKMLEKSSKEDLERKNKHIDSNLENNISILSKIYSIPNNDDVKCHRLTINGINKKAALWFISSITDIHMLNDHVIEPFLRNLEKDKTVQSIIEVQSITVISQIKEAVEGINDGNSVVFVDGEEIAYLLATSNFESRNIGNAQNEVVVKGPKEAFNEKAITNISLIRKKIKNENLIVEKISISKRSSNDLYILYIKYLANDQLVENIKGRIARLDIDAIQNLSLLEQYIEDRPRSIFPSILYTERPDRATSFLEDGYIVLLMNNSPDALVLPATFWSFIHNPEDHYLRFIYGNFIRVLRLAAIFITLFTSAIYVAILNYHSEMVPTDLLLAISSTREKVPFPSLVEIIMMELSFELIREAGLRVPNPIGPTIGIVGALILGQAAVEANIVSPIIVIVVALSGLCSFTISDISLNFAIRILRFAFIFAAGFFGIFGMSALFMIGLTYMVSLKSFGVPYLAPLSPNYSSSKDTFLRRVLFDEKVRPEYLKPNDSIKKAEE